MFRLYVIIHVGEGEVTYRVVFIPTTREIMYTAWLSLRYEVDMVHTIGLII